jgi:DnaJ family protein C protein 28
MNWDRIIEKKIREAQEEGKFDNLRGQGQPLNLDENPFEDPAWRLAHHILKEQGFRPDWLEDDVALRERLAQARAALTRSRNWRAEQMAALGERGDAEAVQRRAWITSEWERAVERFREAVSQINAGIATLNLKVPVERLQRSKLRVEDELRKIAG